MNTTRRTSLNPSMGTRLASLAGAALLTLAMLAGVDGLSAPTSAAGTLVQAKVAPSV